MAEKAIRKFPKRVVEPTEPQPLRRKTRTGPSVPYWKAAGGGPPSVRYAAEPDTTEEQTDA
ncbi:hypothetical protein AB4Z54_27790 [Streptomyces sp. MCAF7]